MYIFDFCLLFPALWSSLTEKTWRCLTSERQGPDNPPEATVLQRGRCRAVIESFLKITVPAESRRGLSQVFILISVLEYLFMVFQNRNGILLMLLL